jgi:hypothetical protein
MGIVIWDGAIEAMEQSSLPESPLSTARARSESKLSWFLFKFN